MIYGPYPARCIGLHDGDTVSFDLDLGFNFRLTANDFQGHPVISCRVYGINAPELKTPEGKAALAYAQTILKPGDICMVKSHGWDKYGGRFDGEITLPDGSDFATAMLTSGHAVPFMV